MSVRSYHAPLASSRGFSLIEVLVAVALVAGAVAGLGQLVTMAMRANAAARAATVSAVLATQKMEQLRAEQPWLLPGGSIQSDEAGFVDFFDGRGQPADPTAVAFVRRWSVAPLASEPVRSRVLRVRVVRVEGRADQVPAWPRVGLNESRLATVVTERER